VWKSYILKWKSENNVPRIKREHIAKIVIAALDLMTTESRVVIAGFTATGLCLFDPSAINYNVFKKKNKYLKETNGYQPKNSCQLATREL